MMRFGFFGGCIAIGCAFLKWQFEGVTQAVFMLGVKHWAQFLKNSWHGIAAWLSLPTAKVKLFRKGLQSLKEKFRESGMRFL